MHMSLPAHLRGVVFPLILLVMAALLVACTSSGGGGGGSTGTSNNGSTDDGSTDNGSDDSSEPVTFTIEASVSGLQPGFALAVSIADEVVTIEENGSVALVVEVEDGTAYEATVAPIR